MPEPYNSPETGEPNVDGDVGGVGVGVGVGVASVGLIDDSNSLIEEPNSEEPNSLVEEPRAVGADNDSVPKACVANGFVVSASGAIEP